MDTGQPTTNHPAERVAVVIELPRNLPLDAAAWRAKAAGQHDSGIVDVLHEVATRMDEATDVGTVPFQIVLQLTSDAPTDPATWSTMAAAQADQSVAAVLNAIARRLHDHPVIDPFDWAY